jgi:hypothetical protein
VFISHLSLTFKHSPDLFTSEISFWIDDVSYSFYFDKDGPFESQDEDDSEDEESLIVDSVMKKNIGLFYVRAYEYNIFVESGYNICDCDDTCDCDCDILLNSVPTRSLFQYHVETDDCQSYYKLSDMLRVVLKNMKLNLEENAKRRKISK